MPFCGTTVSVPVRPVPPTRAIVIGLVAVGSTLPEASSTATRTEGEIDVPATAFVGCCK